ncbi:Phosphoglucosamine mutase [bacterium HR19]|nr:Phosphoglucosamine mutase [bacterium HR19]
MIKFGTDGWRAKIGEDFTFDNVGRVSLALAKYIKEKFKNPEVVIGYDTRFLSEDFAKFAGKVIAEEGIKVFLSDRFCPTPAVSFFISSQKLSGGVAITASHNPYYFNGYKIREWFGGPASPETTSIIEKIIEDIDWEKEKQRFKKESSDKVKKEDIISAYIESVRADSEIDKFLKKVKSEVIFDVMHGACSGLPTRIFGKKAVEVRNEINPLFPPFGKPEPTPYTLTPLQNYCKKFKSDGFAFDGDGDRIYACSKEGKIIDAHKIFAILTEHTVKHKKQKGKVYKTVTASDIIDKVASYYGLEVVTTPVGFKHLIKGMIEDNAIIAGEESGGIGMSYHLKERDSLFCACVFLTHSIIEGKDFSALVKDIEKRFGKHRYIRKDFHVSDEIKEKAVKTAEEIDKINGFKVEKIEKIDGTKIRFKGGGFLLVRPSGTEPVLRVYAETESEETSEKIINSFAKMLNIKPE